MGIEPDAIYTVKETARLLNMSDITIRRWVGKGILASLKLGRSRRIRGQDLLSFLEEASQKAAAGKK